MCVLYRKILLFGIILGLSVSIQAGKTSILIPLSDKADWRDMAFLAAVPAAKKVNKGYPSLISLDENAKITRELDDYLKRFKPDSILSLGKVKEPGSHEVKTIEISSAEDAACKLSSAIWTHSKYAVICDVENYQEALLASSFASRINGPLLFARNGRLSRETQNELKRLKASNIITVGSLKVSGLESLVGPLAIVSWLNKYKVKVNYLAVVNAVDRDSTIVKKLSLSGVLLAAGRMGIVYPMNQKISWKKAYPGKVFKGDLPKGIRKTKEPAKTGSVKINGESFDFIVTYNKGFNGIKGYLDRDLDGKFETELKTGQKLKIGDKEYAISLSRRDCNGFGDIAFTWPHAGVIVNQLKSFYSQAGYWPKLLCLVGMPDTIPMGLLTDGRELLTDLNYSNTDDDEFSEIGVGRFISENASFGTLLASRTLTYRFLLDDEWKNNIGQARWEKGMGRYLKEFGFDASFYHDVEDLNIIRKQKNRVIRERTFPQDSPLTKCSAIIHSDHSSWHNLGHTFHIDANVLLSPSVVESSGCSTCALDRDKEFKSVASRLFRLGAICFTGNSRLGIAQQSICRDEFWNGMLIGLTAGDAHKKGLNSTLLAMKETKANGGLKYSRYIRTFYGDPAFRMYIPKGPQIKPARVSAKDDVITVHAPQKWFVEKIVVPKDWKDWYGKDLYTVKGLGTSLNKRWGHKEGYDLEQNNYIVEFTTKKDLADIKQLGNPLSALGWKGKYYTDLNPDGSITYRWPVCMVKQNQETGELVNYVDKIQYKVIFKE